MRRRRCHAPFLRASMLTARAPSAVLYHAHSRDFHTYRGFRTKEMARQAEFERERKEEAETAEWERERAAAAAEVEARHAKNAAKRNKKKEKRKAAMEAEKEQRKTARLERDEAECEEQEVERRSAAPDGEPDTTAAVEPAKE